MNPPNYKLPNGINSLADAFQELIDLLKIAQEALHTNFASKNVDTIQDRWCW